MFSPEMWGVYDNEREDVISHHPTRELAKEYCAMLNGKEQQPPKSSKSEPAKPKQGKNWGM